ncbi:MAG: hypothetical protein IGS03_07020 [Candidatus Sericytochromatia bacterium]|nr:hypothetical protein [Candidatus Sericytochromatia bacterium]
MFSRLLHLSLLGWLGFAAPEVPPATGLRLLAPEELRAIPLAELPYAGFRLPERVDLSPHMPPPGHQGHQNACVAWVSAYAVKSYQEKLEQRHPLVQQDQPQWQHIFSPAFSYNQINQGRDGGATLVDALNLLSAQGALPWAEMPYDPDNYTRQPSAAQRGQARHYRIAYWRQVNVADPEELKAQLHAGYPVMVGTLIDEGLWQLKKQQRWHRPQGKSLGGHALVLVGYDDRQQAFKVMNSWGPDWADGGFGWIDYRHFRRVAREGYVAKDAVNLPARAQRRLDKSEAEVAKKADAGASEAPAAELSAVPRPAERPVQQPAALADTAEADMRPADPEPLQEERRPSLTLAVRTLEQKLSFSGQFQAAAADGYQARVLVQFFADAAGQQALPIQQVRWQLPGGQGVAASMLQPVSGQMQTWQAELPIALLPEGLQVLWAQPVLYLDGFGVQRGPRIRVVLPRPAAPARPSGLPPHGP